MDVDDAVREVARTLGYSRAGARIQDRVRNELRVAVSRKIIANERGSYSILCRDIHDYTREDRIEALLGAMGRGWIEREEATRAAARHLGFRRTGSSIRAAFKSAITGSIKRGLLEYDGTLIRKAK